MLMATKLDRVSRGPLEVTRPFNHVVLGNYLKNEKHISSITMLLSTNLGRHVVLIVRLSDKLNVISSCRRPLDTKPSKVLTYLKNSHP